MVRQRTGPGSRGVREFLALQMPRDRGLEAEAGMAGQADSGFERQRSGRGSRRAWRPECGAVLFGFRFSLPSGAFRRTVKSYLGRPRGRWNVYSENVHTENVRTAIDHIEAPTPARVEPNGPAGASAALRLPGFHRFNPRDQAT